MLKKAYEIGTEKGLKFHVGNIFCSDIFYRDNNTYADKLMDYGILGVEMESTALYTLAAKYGVNALTILTVSDHLLTGEQTTSEERQTSFRDMMEVALETVNSL